MPDEDAPPASTGGQPAATSGEIVAISPGAALPPAPAPAAGSAPRSVPRHARSAVSVGQLTMLTVVVVVGLRTTVATAASGLSGPLILLVPAALFLVPCALVIAELGAAWPGGVFVWVREALGERWGLQAAWLQWVQNVVWYPTQLAFVALLLRFVLPSLGLPRPGLFTALTVVVLYWASTTVALRGGTLFARLASWGGLLGTLLPAALVVALGTALLVGGHPSEIAVEPETLLPPYSGLAAVVLVVSSVVAFTGLEVNAVHTEQMDDPARDYPRTVARATATVAAVAVLPALVLALTIPQATLDLPHALGFAIRRYTSGWDQPWVAPVLVALVAAGALASTIAWVAGPSRGLLTAARAGLLPPALQRRSRRGAPAGILLLQGALVTALAVLFLVVPDATSVLMVLVEITAALYLVMYMLMFAAALTLRRTHPHTPRPFRAPALPVVATLGFVTSFAAFLMAFVPPVGSPVAESAYPWLTVAVVVLLGVPPVVILALRRPSWDRAAGGHRSVGDAAAARPDRTPLR